MVVGIPRGLLFYEYYPLWRAFFQALGIAVETSGPTSRAVLDAGVSRAVDEACLPVKAYLGHCLELAERCDALFVPRVVSVERGAYTCPKLLGLPEIVGSLRTGRPLVTPVVDYTRGGSRAVDAAIACARRLGCGSVRAAWAYVRARLEYRTFTESLQVAGGWFEGAVAGRAETGTADRARPRVLVLGHVYMVNDRGINLGIREHLLRLGVRPVAPQWVARRNWTSGARALPKKLFWTYEKQLFGAAKHVVDRGECDGVIQITSFGCGPDSLVSEFVRREAERSRVPYMALTVDEHAGEAGAVTRLEAFVDMLARRLGDRET
ncbi:MAG: acyl-CoA dehydratase activase-related protein [Firmicutes bacterium]|jgi:predicted nucleotide-binding protein (sugar kinase/HSP70/actin superfamily)|nr:acyl-CoA dehydratase activase-related protein [Bacillota bacterium]